MGGFLAAYQAALTSGDHTTLTDSRSGEGTWNRLVEIYYTSPNFTDLAPATKASYRSNIERWIINEGIGTAKVSNMTRQQIVEMIARLSDKPGIASNTLKCIRVLVSFAQDIGWRDTDPTQGIRRPKLGSIATWTENNIMNFEDRWPLGTFERTAFSLLLHTGQRSGDVRMMTWSNIQDGLISVTQQKTRRSLSLPVHPALQEALSFWPRNQLVILATPGGKSYTPSAFGSRLATAIKAAGLPGECTPHGLRKAAARRLAEAGCSSRMIMAITGHASLSEVERYTSEAEQKILAEQAMKRLQET